MKKILTIVFAVITVVLFSFTALAVTDINEDTATLVHDTVLKATPVLDGVLDDVYLHSLTVKLHGPASEYFISGGSCDDTTATGTVYALVDDNYVYVFYHVVDNTLIQADPEYIEIAPHPHLSDSVEVRVGDDLEDHFAPYNGSNDAHHLFYADAHGTRFSCYENSMGNDVGKMRHATVLADDGKTYCVELAIPLRKPFEEGEIIEFGFRINDLQDEMDSMCAIGTGFPNTLTQFNIGGQAPVTELAASDKDAVPGDIISIPVELKNNSGITGMKLEVTYPDSLQLTEVAEGTALSSLDMTCSGELTKLPYVIMWDGISTDKSNGTLATLKFKVKETAEYDDYNVNVKVSALNGYLNDMDISDLSVTVSVSEKPKINISGVSLYNETYTYDGEVKTLAVKGRLPEGTSVKYTVDGNEFLGTKDAGEYKVTATVSGKGYNDLVLNATLKINKKNVKITGLTANSKEYDGTVKAVVTGGTLSGVVHGDDLAISEIKAAFAKADVGRSIAVTSEIVTTGNADNYNVGKAPVLYANITVKSVTVASVDLASRTAVIDGIVESDTGVQADLGSIVITKGEPVDDTKVNIVVSGIKLKGTGAENYSLSAEGVPSVVENDKIATVNVTATGGTVTGEGTYLKGTQITLKATPNSNYKFSGWVLNRVIVSNNRNYTFTVTEDTDITAKFEKNAGGMIPGGFIPSGNTSGTTTTDTATYTAMFMSNGEVYKTFTVKNGDKVQNFNDPAIDGFKFGGWYLDSAFSTEFSFDTPVTSNIKVYAKWTSLWKNPYTDVKENEWYYKYVEEASRIGLVNGMTSNTFAPSVTLSRAMLATVLYRLAGSPEVKSKAQFDDVAVDAWYANAVAWAADNGIVNGVGNNSFAPDADITREQMATMLYRYAVSVKADVTVIQDKTSGYSDATSISSYAQDSFKWAVERGIINGDTATTLSPKKNATRAEATALLIRFKNLI